MRSELRKILDDNYDEIVAQLDVDNGLLRTLLSAPCSVLTAEQKASIESKTTRQERVDKLLDILKTRSDEHFFTFCEALGDHQLANILRHQADKSTRYNSQMTPVGRDAYRHVNSANASAAYGHILQAPLPFQIPLPFSIHPKFNSHLVGRDSYGYVNLANPYASFDPAIAAFQVPTSPVIGMHPKLAGPYPYFHDYLVDPSASFGHVMQAALQVPTSPVIVEYSKLVIDKLIGAGGYGRVYIARHPDFPGTVAYKRINAIFMQPWEEAELKGEAKIHMQLDHPNIVKCFAVVFEPENYGMILEFMKHGAAKNYLMNNNSIRSKLNIIKDVSAGMKYLHSLTPPVIHGDLKLENVLMSEDEIAKVCDFGFSRWKKYSKSHSVEAVPLGTVTHVPPERWRDCTVRKNEKFDVYSFGITMWEILTLKLPFSGEHRSALIQCWVENGQRPDLRDIPTNVAENVINLMVECWDEERMKRPSFEDILTRLEME